MIPVIKIKLSLSYLVNSMLTWFNLTANTLIILFRKLISDFRYKNNELLNVARKNQHHNSMEMGN